MQLSEDKIKKVLACDQIAEGLTFNKRPGHQELIFGHILLSYEEGNPATPKDLTRLTGCTPETLRVLLRKAESRGYLCSSGRPDYQIVPCEKMLSLIFKVSQEWRQRNLRRLLPYTPTVGEVYVMTQAFDIYTRWRESLTFIFKTPVKRGITFFILDRSRHGYVELERLKYNFPIDHESLRQFINMMIETGYFGKSKIGKYTVIWATSKLREETDKIVSELDAALRPFSGSIRPYSAFVEQILYSSSEDARAMRSSRN